MAGYEGLGLPDTGGGLLGGLNQSGLLIAQELQKYREKAEKDQQELATSDMIANYARTRINHNTGQPLMDNDTWLKYMNGSKNQKIGLTHGLVATMADDMKEQMANARAENMSLRLGLAEQGLSIRQQEEAFKEKLREKPQIIQVPNPSNPSGAPLNYTMTESGYKLLPAGAQAKPPKPPKLSKDESYVLGWATNRIPVDKNGQLSVEGKKLKLKDKLPNDLQTAYDKLTDPKNAGNPNLPTGWNALKGEIIKRMGIGAVETQPDSE